MLCQLSSKPADQKHINWVRHINCYSLTHVRIISPVLQKVWEVQGNSKAFRIRNVLKDLFEKRNIFLEIWFGLCEVFFTVYNRHGITQLKFRMLNSAQQPRNWTWKKFISGHDIFSAFLMLLSEIFSSQSVRCAPRMFHFGGAVFWPRDYM
jgi:hypothetical protein